MSTYFLILAHMAVFSELSAGCFGMGLEPVFKRQYNDSVTVDARREWFKYNSMKSCQSLKVPLMFGVNRPLVITDNI